MSRKKASLVVIAILLTSTSFLALTILPHNVRATTLFVGGSGPGNFTTIQGAINSSNPGDTIFVFNGTYSENVVVNKTVDLVGEDRNTTIIDGGGAGDVVRIVADWVNMSELTVLNGSPDFSYAGIKMDFSMNNTISNITSLDNNLGIYLLSSNYNTIVDSRIFSNNGGIYLEQSDFNTISNSDFPSNRAGIELDNSNNNTVINSNLSDNMFGVYSEFSHYNIFASNVLSNSTAGILAVESHGNTYADNDASWNENEGIFLEYSNKNIVLNNTFADNPFGVVIYRSSDTTLRDNLMIRNGILVDGRTSPENWNSHTIDTSNTVNGKPVYHWRNVTGGTMPAGAGQVLLVNCTDIVVENQNLSQASVGVQTSYSLGIQISNITASSNEYSMWLHQSNYSNITGNIMSYNSYDMIVDHSNHIIIESNVGSFDRGIWLDDTHNSTVSNNTKTVQLVLSNDNLVYGNTVSSGMGFEILGSNGNLISNNNASTSSGRGLNMDGGLQNTLVNNSFSGVEMQRSSGNVFSLNEITGRGIGLSLFKSSGNLFEDNIISRNNGSGILVFFNSNSNTFFNNTISSNGGTGIEIWDYSDDNLIYHNRFINNSQQAFNDFNCTNQWDNGYPTGGNYWSDYTGTDVVSGPLQNIVGSDGIGDDPYDIQGGWNEDRYPLMSPSGPIFPRPPWVVIAELSGKDMENVTVSWIPSPDDGGGFKTVVRYDILRNTTYDASGMGYGFVGSVPNGTNRFVDVSVGEGNPNNYFYVICAVDFNNNSTCSKFQAGKFTRALLKGPNLVSTPVSWNVSVETVLQTVSYDNAWSYDSLNQEWKSFSKSKPYNGALEHIFHTMGVWVNVTEDSNFTVAGVVPLYTGIDLKAGWNLVGFPSFNTSFTVGDLKASLPVTRVEGLDPTAPPYFLKPLQDSDFMLPGHGYWIQVSSDSTWTLYP